MNFFTRPRYKLSAYLFGKNCAEAGTPPLCRNIPAKKLITRVGFTLALLISAFVQMGFAVPVTGRVTDEKGDALSGVSVTLKGSVIGASTGADGRYSINVPDLRGTLVFSFVGHTAQEIDIKGRSVIDVSLADATAALNDVVVVGYGRQKKVNLVGSVSTVTVDEKLTNRAVPNISSGLAGLVPGLAAVQNSGMAGNNRASLVIRGLGSVNGGSAPLLVVDGMPDVDINRININDIETVTVLKDASSASVYGSPGGQWRNTYYYTYR